MKKIKYIIFDLGAVLLNIDYQKTIDGFKKLGVKKFSLNFTQKKTQKNIFDLLECGKISDKGLLISFKKNMISSVMQKLFRLERFFY